MKEPKTNKIATKGKTRRFLACLFFAALVSGAPAQTKPGWNLVWSDEFDGPTLSTAKWTVSNGPSNVNQELEYYSNRTNNVFIQNGCLVLRAVAENYQGRNYTSGKVVTQGKGDWLYGRVEVRAKLNDGQGMWPAIWMMPTDNAYGGWPASGEMDIMELLGNQPNKVYGTIHWAQNGANTQSGSSFTMRTGTFADTFHVFAYEWDVNQQRWYVDDSLYFSTARGQPFDKRFFLILNVAVGGSWPGNPNASTQFPNDMVIDYARVYQKSTSILTSAAAPSNGEFVPKINSRAGELWCGPHPCEVTIWDLSGKEVRRLVMPANATCDYGRNMAPGTFLLKAVSAGRIFTGKISIGPLR